MWSSGGHHPLAGLPLNRQQLIQVGSRKKRKLVTPEVAVYLP